MWAFEEDDDVGSFEEPPASAALHGHGEKAPSSKGSGRFSRVEDRMSSQEPGGPAEAGKVRHEMSLEARVLNGPGSLLEPRAALPGQQAILLCPESQP